MQRFPYKYSAYVCVYKNITTYKLITNDESCQRRNCLARVARTNYSLEN